MLAVYRFSDSVCVAAIPKAGSTAIGNAGMCTPIKGEQVKSYLEWNAISRRVVFLRDPVDRFRSAFSFAYWLDKAGSSNDLVPPGFFAEAGDEYRCYEKFVDFVLDSGAENEHWKPQEWLIRRSSFLANEFYDFRDISPWFWFTFGISVPVENAAKRIAPWSTYRLGEVAEYYSRDYSLMRQELWR